MGVNGPLALASAVWNTEEQVKSGLANEVLTPYLLPNGLLRHLMTYELAEMKIDSILQTSAQPSPRNGKSVYPWICKNIFNNAGTLQ